MNVISQKDQLIQGILYRLLLLVVKLSLYHGSAEKHLEIQHQGQAIGPILVSALQLYVSLYASAYVDGAWDRFERFLQLMAFGDAFASNPPVANPVPEAWATVIEVARSSNTLKVNRARACMLRFASDMGIPEQTKEGNGIDWFSRFMQRIRELASDNGVCDEGGMWDAVDVNGAGVLFLTVWEEGMETRCAGLATAAAWTSSDAIEAFSIWLRIYYYQETGAIPYEENDSITTQASESNRLVLRFMGHTLTENPSASVEFGIDDTVARVRKVGEDGEASTATPEAWEQVRYVVRVARRLVALQRHRTDPAWWRYGGLSGVCRADHMQVL
ncbi:hypothetical protein FRB95_005447 [Tulasnella sp. JGI-2019a]|nr:hypothetical protein FRB95_005447 [Tulasnella sp. JGI-2019a]